jgi:tRNA(fMet)-specific endonuclease VapC
VTGNSVALDTSVAIDVLAGRAESLTSQPITEFLLPVIVIGELRYGALNSRRADENLAEVERLVTRCRVMDVITTTAEVYARLRLSLKAEPGERSVDRGAVRRVSGTTGRSRYALRRHRRP